MSTTSDTKARQYEVLYDVLTPNNMGCMSVTGLMEPRQGFIVGRSCEPLKLFDPVFHIGSITETIKTVRCVCCYCNGMPPNNPQIKEILMFKSKGQSRKRLTYVYDLGKENQQDGPNKEPGHLGCGHYHPSLRRTGKGQEDGCQAKTSLSISGQPGKRLANVPELWKDETICERSEDMNLAKDNQQVDPNKKTGHRDCGPSLRRTGKGQEGGCQAKTMPSEKT